MRYFGLVRLPGTLPFYLTENKGLKILGQFRTSMQSTHQLLLYTLQSQTIYAWGLIPAEAKFLNCLDLKDTFFFICLAPQSQPIFSFQWESPSIGEKGQLTCTRSPQCYKNSPTLFGDALASYPKAFSADQHGCTLLQYKDDLQLARPTQEDVWKELTSFSPFVEERT
jgi:hypothetical protein